MKTIVTQDGQIQVWGIAFRSRENPEVVLWQPYETREIRDAELAAAREIATSVENPGEWSEITPYDSLPVDSPVGKTLIDVYEMQIKTGRVSAVTSDKPRGEAVMETNRGMALQPGICTLLAEALNLLACHSELPVEWRRQAFNLVAMADGEPGHFDGGSVAIFEQLAGWRSKYSNKPRTILADQVIAAASDWDAACRATEEYEEGFNGSFDHLEQAAQKAEGDLRDLVGGPYDRAYFVETEEDMPPSPSIAFREETITCPMCYGCEVPYSVCGACGGTGRIDRDGP